MKLYQGGPIEQPKDITLKEPVEVELARPTTRTARVAQLAKAGTVVPVEKKRMEDVIFTLEDMYEPIEETDPIPEFETGWVSEPEEYMNEYPSEEEYSVLEEDDVDYEEMVYLTPPTARPDLGSFVLPATIGSAQVLRCLIDTGTARSVLPYQSMKRLTCHL